MEQLEQVHFIYHFSLKFFLDIFHGILHNNPHLEGITEASERLEILLDDLFRTVYRRVSRGLLHEDHLTFSLRLAQIRLRGTADQLGAAEFDFLVKGGESFNENISSDFSNLFTPPQQRLYSELKELNCFSRLKDNIQNNTDEWSKFLEATDAENHIPKCWDRRDGRTGTQ